MQQFLLQERSGQLPLVVADQLAHVFADGAVASLGHTILDEALEGRATVIVSMKGFPCFWAEYRARRKWQLTRFANVVRKVHANLHENCLDFLPLAPDSASKGAVPYVYARPESDRQPRKVSIRI
jgi:hypothetical protein